MKTKNIIFILIFICLINPVYSLICEEEVQQEQQCFMITPVISCDNYTYDVFDSGGFINESGNLSIYADSIYYFNFSKSGIDYYTIIICNGQTRIMNVIQADDNFTTNYTVDSTTPILKDLGFSLNFKTFMDLNITYPITLITVGNISGLFANITLINTTLEMNEQNNNFVIYVNSNVSEDTNFSINVYNSSNDLIQQINDTLKFRIPFLLTFSLFTDKETEFNTNFDYIYLRKKTSTISPTAYADVGTSFSYFVTFGLWTRLKIDETTTFWGVVNDNEAIIKMYEPGNYSINLLSMKTFNVNGWSDEFIKPQYTNSKVETTLDNTLLITEGIDQNIKLLLSTYEVNKSGFIFDIFKWIFIAVVIVSGIVFSFVGGVPAQGLSATLIIVTLLIKLLGLA